MTQQGAWRCSARTARMAAGWTQQQVQNEFMYQFRVSPFGYGGWETGSGAPPAAFRWRLVAAVLGLDPELDDAGPTVPRLVTSDTRDEIERIRADRSPERAGPVWRYVPAL